MSLGICGCGLETYEKRLDATRGYFAYLDKLDQNLAQPWRTFPVDAFRPPIQFKEIPAPEGELKPDGTREMPDVDPRQPDYANLYVDGLIGAWRAEVDVVENNERAAKPAYIYVAANSEKFLADKIEEAVNFTKTFVPAVESALGTTSKAEPAIEYPKGHQFVTKQRFDVNLLNSSQSIAGTRYVVEIYATNVGDNQVVVMLVAPEGMDPTSKVSERTQLSLESMKISAARPQPKQAGATGQPSATPQSGAF